MKTADEGPEKMAYTLDDFLQTARDRGQDLRTEVDGWGVKLVTNGKRRYALPRLREGRLPYTVLVSLCEYFFLPPEDFGLDAGPED